jgi:hypothetical protein
VIVMRRDLLMVTLAAAMTAMAVASSPVTAAPADEEEQAPLFVAANREIASTLRIAVCITEFDPLSGKGEYGVSTLGPNDTAQGACAVVPTPLPPTRAAKDSAQQDSGDSYGDGWVTVARDGVYGASTMAFASGKGEIHYSQGDGYLGRDGVTVSGTDAAAWDGADDRAPVDPDKVTKVFVKFPKPPGM